MTDASWRTTESVSQRTTESVSQRTTESDVSLRAAESEGGPRMITVLEKSLRTVVTYL